MSWRAELARSLHRTAASAESIMDRGRRQIARQFGTGKPRRICAYRGFAAGGAATVQGRVLSNRPAGGPKDDGGLWRNLVNTYRRWESDEVAGAPVTLTFDDQRIETVTDEEGYYRAEF